MNILELQDNLKDLPDSALMREMQMPSGNAPQFLVLSELKRRKRMRDDFQRQQNADMPTVAEEVVTAAGMPQEGIMGAARAMAPNTNMAQNTGMDTATPIPATRAPQPQMMADGGIVKMQTGGITEYPSINPLIGNVDLSQIAAMLQSGADKEALVANYGADAVREAESMLLPFMKKSIGQIPLGSGSLTRREIRRMEDQGIFGNKSYRDIGGEGIGSVSADVEDFAAAPLADERRDDDPELPEDPLRPRTGFGSNPAYTYETFLEENQINDTPQAQEMFIRYKDYMNERGPTSDPKVYSPFLDDSPELKSPVDSGKLPSISSMDEEFAANTLYPEGIGTATQEFLQKRNAGFGDGSDEFEPIPYLSSISKDADQRASAEAETDKPTFMGDVLPFLGDAAVAAGKSLYENTLKPEPLLEVGAVPNKREVLEGQIADINQQILDAEQANDEILANALTKRKNVLMRRIDTMEFSEDAGEALRNVPGALQDVGSSIYQTFNEQVLAGVDPRLAAANIKASQDAVAARDLENEAGIESEAEREARIEALRGDATEVVPGISTDVSGFFPNLEMENPNIGDPTTPAPKVTTDDNIDNIKPVTDPDPEGFGSTDSRIAKMLSERQKQAESDKWMALAYAGFKLMEPTSTIGEGFGKAGQAGLAYLTKSKKGLRDFETDMLKLQTTLDAARLRSQRADKTSATAYAALERSYSEALELATQNPSAPNLARLKELEDLVREARAVQFGAVTADNTNSGVIKTPSAQT
tara:strand:- start:5244 stop:7523 length:2280 start_codon:yes stop_codon:yes gene_type:complete